MTSIPSAILTAILILAREILRSRGLRELPTSAVEISRVMRVSRSQAYAMKARLEEALERLYRTPGPSPRSRDTQAEWDLLVAIRDFLMANPGSVETRGSRRIYHQTFRDFVIEQLGPGGSGASLTHDQIVEVVGIPLGTLKDWLAHSKKPDPAPVKGAPVEEDTTPVDFETSIPEIATILKQYPLWKGSFQGFCEHLWTQWRIPYRRTFISQVLEMAGFRKPARRGRKARPWSQDAFLKLFPGAQWIGDGKKVIIRWQGQEMAFNIEAFVDTATNAIVGIEVSDTEDEQVVLDAHAHARATTGGDPLIVTLDQRPSNHTDTVREAVAPAELLASTKARPTAKATVEGTFGLLSQSAPPLVVEGDSPREQARSVLKLYLLGWAWARNGRPRSRLDGKTPTDAYKDARPTPEQVAEAKAHIAKLKRRIEEAHKTLEAKADPIRRQILEENLAKLGIADPDNRLGIRLAAAYSEEAILQGLATYRAKVQQGTIPRKADPGAYLGGIIRNIHGELEDRAFAEELLDLRVRRRDLSIRELEEAAERIRRENPAPRDLCWNLLDRILEATALIDFHFWTRQLEDAFETVPSRMACFLYSWMTRRISQAYRVPRERRRQLIGTLAAAIAFADTG